MTRKSEQQEFRIDAASALSRGGRDYQEDSVIADFSRGAEFGFAVLADGMGGHASGEVASKIVVTEVFRTLMLHRNSREKLVADAPGVLRDTVRLANECVKKYVEQNPKTRGMGATLVASVIVGDSLHWVSVGDSPLLLLRNGKLRQLNEDHSLGPEIDLLVKKGELSAEEGRIHPDRGVLTSVVFGDKIPKIDCPAEPFQLTAGDILIVASDGLQFLSNQEIENLLLANPLSRADQLADLLIGKLEMLEEPDLDNVSMSVIRVMAPSEHCSVSNSVKKKRQPRDELSFASHPLQKTFRSTRELLKESYTTKPPEVGSNER